MIISSKDAASVLGVSEHKLFKAKRFLGFAQNTQIQTEDMDRIRAVCEKKMRTGGKKNPNFPGYYKTALEIIREEGYISNYNLIKLFQVTHAAHVESYFESMDNPIYSEKYERTINEKRESKNYNQKYKKKWMLLKPLFEQWREENRHNGRYSNEYRRLEGGNLF